MRIDNKRILSLSPPEFAPCPGLTYLFVNPGKNLEAGRGKERDPDLHSDLSSPELALYRGLDDALLEFEPVPGSGSRGPGALAAELGVCVMPGGTYHVTACDFLHDENIRPDAGALRAAFHEAVRAMPPEGTLSLPHPVRERIELRAPVAFEFASLELRGTEGPAGDHCAALVANMAPLARCAAEYARLEEARGRIDEAWGPLGRVPGGKWRPHVTLAYLAYRQYFDRIRRLLPVWEPIVQAMAKGKSVEFAEVRLYVFADMARFWRSPQIAAAQSGEAQL